MDGDPRAEAYDRLGGAYEVRVLEPSPPAVKEGPFFADDPVAIGDVPSGRQVVTPVPGGDLLWADLAREDESLRGFCADRWLGAYRRLEPLPPEFAATRVALHRVAEQLLKPARERANGKFGLRYTRAGFGTPFFADDVQIRVEGAELVVQAAGERRAAAIAGLAQAAELIGTDLLPDPPGDEPLEVEPAAAAALADWFGFAASVIEELRAEAPPEGEPSRAQLWPEHFDLAFETGSEAEGVRAGYGCSPGDEQHPEPYLYVTPWTAQPSGELWGAAGFTGAELSYADLVAAPDQRGLALDFFRTRRDDLQAGDNHA